MSQSSTLSLTIYHVHYHPFFLPPFFIVSSYYLLHHHLYHTFHHLFLMPFIIPVSFIIRFYTLPILCVSPVIIFPSSTHHHLFHLVSFPARYKSGSTLYTFSERLHTRPATRILPLVINLPHNFVTFTFLALVNGPGKLLDCLPMLLYTIRLSS